MLAYTITVSCPYLQNYIKVAYMYMHPFTPHAHLPFLTKVMLLSTLLEPRKHEVVKIW